MIFIYFFPKYNIQFVGWVEPNINKMVSMAGLVSDYCFTLSSHSLSFCFRKIVVRFAPCYFELGSLRSPSLYAKSSEPAFGGLKSSRIDYTKELEQRSILLYGVDGVTKLEPDNKNNLPYKMGAVNLIRLLDEYTEDYFNMKIAVEKYA